MRRFLLRLVVSFLMPLLVDGINRKAHPDAARPEIPQIRSMVNQKERHRPTLRAVETYACSGCLATATNQTARRYRVLYLESPFTVVNSAADQAAEDAGTGYSCGSCCSDPNLARPECFVADNWNGGWVASIIHHILGSLGAEVDALTTANYSAATLEPSGGSTYERCIWEVYYGTVDLCVGSFWETHSRRSMILFTSPIDINNFKLVTMAELGSDFDMLSIFAPFSAWVWGMMLVMFAVTAVLMWIVQSEEAETDFDDNEVFPKPRGLVKGMWIALMGYVSGPDPRFVTTSWAARLITLGFGFFLYITVSAYTANLASFMVLRKQASSQITSLTDIVNGGHKLCSNMDMDGMLTTPEPSTRKGDCQAAVVGKYEWSTYIMGSNAKYVFCNDTTDGNAWKGYFCFNPDSNLAHVDLAECVCTDDAYDAVSCPDDLKDCSDVFKFCNVIEIQDPTFDANLNVALPATAALEPYVSAWLVKLKQSGVVSTYIYNELWAQNPDRCPAGTAGGSSGSLVEDASELNLQSMAGTYIISGAFMVVGLTLHIIAKIMACRKAGTVDPDPAAADKKPEANDVHVASTSSHRHADVGDHHRQQAWARERGLSTMGRQMSMRGAGAGGGRDLGRQMEAMQTEMQELRAEVRGLVEAVKLAHPVSVRSEAVMPMTEERIG